VLLGLAQPAQRCQRLQQQRVRLAVEGCEREPALQRGQGRIAAHGQRAHPVLQQRRVAGTQAPPFGQQPPRERQVQALQPFACVEQPGDRLQAGSIQRRETALAREHHFVHVDGDVGEVQ
jgi:hypothetical protein